MRRWHSTTAALVLLGAGTLRAQDPAALATRLAAMTAVSGFEQKMADSVQALVPGARLDRAGDVLKSFGAGSGGLLVACPLDEPGYVVGEIRADGWLTLRRVGSGADPKFDQRQEGERVTVWGSRGALPGVVAVRSVHLTRGRGAGDQPFTVDDALVDVGAANPTQAAAGGVAVLAPVAREKRPTRYGKGLLAGPWAGRRGACAAVVTAAAAAHPTERVVVAFTVEQGLGARGMLTVMHTDGPFDRTILVDGRAGALGTLMEGSDSALGVRYPGFGKVSRLSLPTKYPGTAVETISLADVQALATRLSTEIGGAR